MFEAKLPARQFKGYVCSGVEGYAADAAGNDVLDRDQKTDTVTIETANVGR